jgi:predicted nucleic acid-binding protein
MPFGPNGAAVKMRVVLDTNVVVSALLWGGQPKAHSDRSHLPDHHGHRDKQLDEFYVNMT